RPLAMGRISVPATEQEAGRKDAIVFASESCAFDLIGATYEREVKPGEMVVVGPEGMYSRYDAPKGEQSNCIFEHAYFSRPDSIVRGTTSRKIVRMVRNAGAREVHMLISCPPTISPCFYGVDTPSKKQLIAANKSVEEIRQYIGADSLAYLSLEGMKQACGEG